MYGFFIQFIYLCDMGKRLSKKSHPTYNINPSVVLMAGLEFADKNEKPKFKKGQLADEETGEVKTVYVLEEGLNDGFVKDALSYDKVFKDFRFGSLIKSACQVMDYIRSQTTPKAHEVRLVPTEVIDYCKWGSRRSFYDALECLLDNEIIYNKTGNDHFYFLNVNKIFNGDRTYHYRKLHEKAKKDSDLKENIEQTKLIYHTHKNKIT